MARKPQQLEACYTRLGDRVLMARTLRNLTQAEVAKHMGVPQSHVAKIERGAVRTQLHDLPKLAKAIDIPIDMLIHNIFT